MPPVLNPKESKVDGLAFLGLSLARRDDRGHPNSVTHQTAFDLNRVQDRDYQYVMSTNDDGWLVGGGEPPDYYKLPAPDSAHVEILRIGTYRPEWGGIALDTLLETLNSGKILIPQIEALPTDVIANPDTPPELEIRFDMEYEIGAISKDDFVRNPTKYPLPYNWQLRFLHNQLFRIFQNPSRFCPGAHHSTILRKAEFRSPQHKADYFRMCQAAIADWKSHGSQPLLYDPKHDTPGIVRTPPQDPNCTSGLYLFRDRNHVTHHFAPNWLPPYDNPEARAVIYEFTKDIWEEATLSWKLPAAAVKP